MSASPTIIRGTFDVTLTPQTPDPGHGAAEPGRFTIDKQFHGDLDAHSLGQMLAIRTGVAGSAGYVAMERVRGTLQGRPGTFALQHSGTMTRGVPGLTLNVVPDSGTEALVGLSGAMEIIVADGTHSYVFSFTLPRLD